MKGKPQLLHNIFPKCIFDSSSKNTCHTPRTSLFNSQVFGVIIKLILIPRRRNHSIWEFRKKQTFEVTLILWKILYL